KGLCYDCNPVLAEYFFASDHRIQCTQSRIVKCNYRTRDSALFERFFHLQRFVIVTGTVVAAKNKMSDLTFVIKSGVHFYALVEERVGPSRTGTMARTENECDAVGRQLRHI